MNPQNQFPEKNIVHSSQIESKNEGQCEEIDLVSLSPELQARAMSPVEQMDLLNLPNLLKNIGMQSANEDNFTVAA